jgi:hypothetical protein
MKSLRLKVFRGVAALAVIELTDTAASAQEGGFCTDDIAKLKRRLGLQAGVGTLD